MTTQNTPKINKKPNPLIKLAIDFGPLLVFFIANANFGIFNATGAFMVAMVVALVASKKLLNHIPVMTLVTGVIVMVFGGLTLYLNDETFIKLKPTIINGMFATILFVGLARGKFLLERVFGPAFPPMEQRGWYLLTRNWAVFFVFLALLNEYIWRNYSTDFWVSFKVFGMMPISLVFTFTQVPILMKYADMSEDEEEGNK